MNRRKRAISKLNTGNGEVRFRVVTAANIPSLAEGTFPEYDIWPKGGIISAPRSYQAQKAAYDLKLTEVGENRCRTRVFDLLLRTQRVELKALLKTILQDIVEKAQKQTERGLLATSSAAM